MNIHWDGLDNEAGGENVKMRWSSVLTRAIAVDPRNRARLYAIVATANVKDQIEYNIASPEQKEKAVNEEK